ncbi:MAG: hypothetical protein RLZZ330_278 [Actinomycetota bacterium]
MTELTTHWTEIHQTKDKDVSWWQESLWLDFLKFTQPSGAAIDIGAGQSPIGIELVKAGYSPVYINDLAVNALDKSVATAKAENIELIALPGDVLNLDIPTKVNLWHDRAVFHFLTDEADIAKYRTKVTESTAPNAVVAIATFSEAGPDQCSGLNVRKYSPTELTEFFSPEFKALHSEKRIHKTPWDSEQEFSIAILQKN